MMIVKDMKESGHCLFNGTSHEELRKSAENIKAVANFRRKIGSGISRILCVCMYTLLLMYLFGGMLSLCTLPSSKRQDYSATSLTGSRCGTEEMMYAGV
jgi:hypothetical protein